MIGPDVIRTELPLDRLIQKIQSYKRVSSARLHPLLCAFTSAESVSYCEQRESRTQEVSGKFRSLLLDVFRRDYPEGKPFEVDRSAVIKYKEKVAAGVLRLSSAINRLIV